MAQIMCKQCGAENDSKDRFCRKCDFYFAWDGDNLANTPQHQDDTPVSAPDPSRDAPRSDGGARPPQITLSTTTTTLAGDTGAQIDIEVRNRSTIVDAFRVDLISPPQWLTLPPREVRVLPNESGVLPAISASSPMRR